MMPECHSAVFFTLTSHLEMNCQCKYLSLATWGQQNKTKTADMKVVEAAAWTRLKSGHMPLRPEAFLGLGGFNIYSTIIF